MGVTPLEGLRAITASNLAGVPGLTHGFEQREQRQGVETRDETRTRVTRALGELGRLYLLHQVHGARLVRAPFEGRPEGDAAKADEAGVLLGIETADCLPVLLVDRARRRVAAAHAGWRGSAAGVVIPALEELLAEGGAVANVYAALGPCIGPCCYEVGDELREAFGPTAAQYFVRGKTGRTHLDLAGVNEAQLLAHGVPAAHIERVNHCTSCRADRYHSFRRDGPGSGRMISWIGYALPEAG